MQGNVICKRVEVIRTNWNKQLLILKISRSMADYVQLCQRNIMPKFKSAETGTDLSSAETANTK